MTADSVRKVVRKQQYQSIHARRATIVPIPTHLATTFLVAAGRFIFGNVQEHATQLAGASVERGVEVGAT